LAAAHPADRGLQNQLATAKLDYGFKLFNIRHDSSQALQQMQPAVKLLESLSAADPGNRRTARTLSMGYGRLAEILASDGKTAQEYWSIQLKQLHVLDSLVASAPANGDFAHLRAFAQHYAVATLLQTGQLDEATKLARSELDSFRALSKADPKIEEYHIDIGLALDDTARISLRLGSAAAAVQNLQEALTETAGVGAGSSSSFRMVRADTQSLLGEAMAQIASDNRRDSVQRQRDRKESCHQMGEALAAYQGLTGTISEATGLAQRQAQRLDWCKQAI
jgi:tetratricopeptide (TPR) repeat protein